MNHTYHHRHYLRESIIFIIFLLIATLQSHSALTDKGEMLIKEGENAISSRQYDLLEKKADEFINCLFNLEAQSKECSLKTISTETFDINGIRTRGLVKGVNIMRTTYSDGIVKTSKFIVK